jgi:hypothetical protein
LDGYQDLVSHADLGHSADGLLKTATSLTDRSQMNIVVAIGNARAC